MALEDFRRIVDSLKVAVAIADAKGAILFANNALAELAGRESTQLANVSFASLFAADAQKRIQQNIARVGEGKASSAFVDAELGDGAKSGRWVQVAFQPALDARDKAAGVGRLLNALGPQRATE